MQNTHHNEVDTFFTRKVSTNQAIKVLQRNGIQVNEEQAQLILNFLYLLAKGCKSIDYLDRETD